ncbi:hypothetical protein [Ramlibacter alkalitolerans]|uniref:Uncharacterized protein n=1 Tax=Ramlibacter alkalitolerans TaxID=2039631 RepID=A0ABS1JUJ2_9BURK|nr:hypothetical protein [Ramlibacter alkalitolerans]MBL0427877.1 hypothetical protein [Ramlibacter alkalitolerans]
MSQNDIPAAATEAALAALEKSSNWSYTHSQMGRLGKGYVLLAYDETEISYQAFRDAGVSETRLKAAGIPEFGHGHTASLVALDANLNFVKAEDHLVDRSFSSLERLVERFTSNVCPFMGQEPARGRQARGGIEY